MVITSLRKVQDSAEGFNLDPDSRSLDPDPNQILALYESRSPLRSNILEEYLCWVFKIYLNRNYPLQSTFNVT
jgi:hypothetical protein